MLGWFCSTFVCESDANTRLMRNISTDNAQDRRRCVLFCCVFFCVFVTVYSSIDFYLSSSPSQYGATPTTCDHTTSTIQLIPFLGGTNLMETSNPSSLSQLNISPRCFFSHYPFGWCSFSRRRCFYFQIHCFIRSQPNRYHYSDWNK